jgi:hypothetical protein
LKAAIVTSIRFLVLLVFVLSSAPGFAADPPAATKPFTVKDDRAYLDGKPVKLWGLRCGNALMSEAVVERHIRNLDNMAAHGINCLGVYIQGSNGGFPDPEAGLNGFTRTGQLKPEVAKRLEDLVREADKRGMVVMVGLFSPRKDQAFYGEDAIKTAVEQAGKFLVERKLRNVFVDIMHEYNHPERIDQPLFREPEGEKKKAKLAAWFKAVAPEILTGVCPTAGTDTADEFPGMGVRLIQKKMKIADKGFVVNVETLRQDGYENDGVFNASAKEAVIADCQRYAAAPNAAMLFHSAFIQGIGNASKTAPHAEMGGYGSGPNDRGVRFYYEWVRDHAGKWEYPNHVPVKKR